MKRKNNIGRVVARITMLALIFCCGHTVWAQQDPVYSQYMNNVLSVNPGYAGLRGCASVSTVFRKQWVNLAGAPTSAALSFSSPWDSTRVGLGFDLMQTKNTPTTYSSAFINYSYKVKASATTMVSFGLKAGFNYMDGRLTNLYRHDIDDPYIIQYGDFTRFMPNFGVGVFLFSPNFSFGLSVPRILRNEYHPGYEVTSGYSSREERHYFIQGSYVYKVNPILYFKPGLSSIVVAGAPVTADFDFSFLLYERFWVGAMYRISDAVGCYTQLQINENLKLGIAYDYTHNALSQFNNGTFEVLIRYDFRLKNNQTLPEIAF